MDEPTKTKWMDCNARPTVNPLTISRRTALAGLGAVGGGILTAKPARADDLSTSDLLTTLNPRQPAPNFTLNGVLGKTYSLSQFRGKVVLVNFWATWCPPCRAEMPSIQKLYHSLAGAPFEVLALDQSEDQSTVFAYLGELDPMPTFPVLLDQNGTVANAFNVDGFPTTYLVDKAGKIAYKAVGGRDYASSKIKKIIVDLMKE
jgi:thiol-disulfide isomerase/thioredoxin